jgi:hypothetical protein
MTDAVSMTKQNFEDTTTAIYTAAYNEAISAAADVLAKAAIDAGDRPAVNEELARVYRAVRGLKR